MMCMLLDTYLSASKIYYHHSLNVNPARILVGIFSLLLNSLKWTLVRRQHSISLQSCISRDLSWYSEFLSETLMHNLLPSTYKFFTPKQYVQHQNLYQLIFSLFSPLHFHEKFGNLLSIQKVKEKNRTNLMNWNSPMISFDHRSWSTALYLLSPTRARLFTSSVTYKL